MAPAREILIVDDEVGIRELLSEILQDEGYRVAVAENASEAAASSKPRKKMGRIVMTLLLSGAN